MLGCPCSPRLASPCQTRFRTRRPNDVRAIESRAAAEKKDRLEAISLPTVTHALPTYGSCLATRCRFAPRADCGRTSCASTTAHMCILGLTHTLTDSCNPAKLSGRPLWQHDTGGSSSSRTGAHPHVRPGEKSIQTGCCSRIDLPRSAISTPELPMESCHSPARSVFSRGRFFVGAKPPHGERTRPDDERVREVESGERPGTVLTRRQHDLDGRTGGQRSVVGPRLRGVGPKAKGLERCRRDAQTRVTGVARSRGVRRGVTGAI